MLIGLCGVLLAACTGERPRNLGVQGGILAACPSSPNCVSSFATAEGQRIAPLACGADPAADFLRLRQILTRRGDATIIEEGSDYLRVELRTTFFVDDAEFLLDRTARVIQVRSASRLGYSDLGKNRSRIEELRRQYDNGPR